MREQLKEQELSFTELAKIVGEKWQVLRAEEREQYEQRAAASKERYQAEMAAYKKTELYAQYQDYLLDFKAKNEPEKPGERRSASSQMQRKVYLLITSRQAATARCQESATRRAPRPSLQTISAT